VHHAELLLLLLLLLLLQIESSDADSPWFCCLHPDPDLASCLIPEEQHDGNTTAAALHDEGGTPRYSYSSMPGFLPAADVAKASSPLFGAAGVSRHRSQRRSTAAEHVAGGDAAEQLEDDNDELQQLHESNVAHFSAVLNSLPEFGESPWLQQLALWLSQQQPGALAGAGVAVPRDIVKSAPDYGELTHGHLTTHRRVMRRVCVVTPVCSSLRCG
jgi:hypothetical protein